MMFGPSEVSYWQDHPVAMGVVPRVLHMSWLTDHPLSRIHTPTLIFFTRFEQHEHNDDFIHKMLNLWNKRTEKIWNNISHEIWSWRSLGPKSGHPQGQNHLTPKRSSTPGARRQHLRSNFEVLKQIWGERMTYDDIMGWNQTCVYNIIIFVYIYIHIWTAIWLGACPWPPFDYHVNAKMRFQTTCFPTKPLKNEHEPLESRQMQQEMKNEPVTACRIEVNMY